MTGCPSVYFSQFTAPGLKACNPSSKGVLASEAKFNHVLAKYLLAAGAMFDQAMTHGAVHSNFPVRKIMRKGNAYRGRRREVALDFFLKI